MVSARQGYTDIKLLRHEHRDLIIMLDYNMKDFEVKYL